MPRSSLRRCCCCRWADADVEWGWQMPYLIRRTLSRSGRWWAVSAIRTHDNETKRDFQPVTSPPSSSHHTESTEAGVKYLCIREVSWNFINSVVWFWGFESEQISAELPRFCGNSCKTFQYYRRGSMLKWNYFKAFQTWGTAVSRPF